MIVGSLGKVIFAVSSQYIKTINDLNINSSVEYAEHKIIKGKPKLEYLNQNLKTVSFKIRLSASHNVNPLAAAKELENYMIKGEVLRFIMGTKSKGKFVITDLKEGHKYFSPIGTVIVMDLDISIKEYN
ncbi:MAG: phage tail protein [Cetobacterium sp.]|uniref:phage tail protein n=1 Tax=Cetobacterium sp. TaxID=2071632 RepID=UPI003F337BAC